MEYCKPHLLSNCKQCVIDKLKKNSSEETFILKQENKKLKTLIRAIYDDLVFRAKIDREGVKTLDISRGILEEMRAVLEE